MIVIVMGMAGAGKSTVGLALSHRLHWDFKEGDALHPPANVDKMRAGVPLSDEDRLPWLDAVAAWIAEQDRARRSGVISCSALRKAARDRLRERSGAALRFVFLDISAELARARLSGRSGHFMPASLVDSQRAALEPPTAEPDVLRLSADQSVEVLCAKTAQWLAVPQ
jgi:gluconokinase